eukprot:scaffold88197_cov37-Cyclotella_meneghiniana.AAC.3
MAPTIAQMGASPDHHCNTSSFTTTTRTHPQWNQMNRDSEQTDESRLALFGPALPQHSLKQSIAAINRNFDSYVPTLCTRKQEETNENPSRLAWRPNQQNSFLVVGAVLNGRLSPLNSWYKVYMEIKVPTNDCYGMLKEVLRKCSGQMKDQTGSARFV